MDGYAGDLGEAFFYGVFEGGSDIVDAGDGEIALHGAVAGDEDVVLNLADADVVGVEEFVVGGGHVVEKGFDGQFELAHFAGANVWRGDVAAERLDVNVDVNVSFAETADAIFEFGGAAMGFAEGKIFVHFKMEFDEEVVVLLGRGDIVDGETQAESDGADGFEEMFVAGGARLRVNDDIGGNNLRDALFDAVCEFVDLLKIGGAGDADGRVHKIAIAGAAEANAIHLQNSRDAADGGHDFVLHALGRGVEKSVEGAAAELRADPEDYSGDGKAGEGVRVGEPGKIPAIAGPDKGDTEDDDDGAPDVGGKMKRVGFECFAGMTPGDGVERARAGEINGESDEKNEDGGEGGLNVDGVEEEAIEGFIDDVDGGEEEQAGFDEGGEIFKFAVAVGVALVGRLIGNADGEKGDDGGDEVEAGVQGFGENAEAVCAKDEEGFKAEEKRGGTNTEKGGAFLFLNGGLEGSGEDHEIRLHQVEGEW